MSQQRRRKRVAYRNPGSVLVAEDDPEIRELLQNALSLAGFEVDVCGDGATALARARRGGYSLILLDHRMPRMIGISVLRAIRKLDLDTPAILMSCQLPDEIRKEVRFHAPAAILKKPFTLDHLDAVLRRTLRSARVTSASGAPSRS